MKGFRVSVVVLVLLSAAAVWAQKPDLIVQTGPGGVQRMAFSPDARLLATESQDGRVLLWDVASGDELRALPALHQETNNLLFSDDGRLLARLSNNADPTSAADRVKLEIWETATGRKLHESSCFCSSRQAHGAPIAFSRAGERLAFLAAPDVPRGLLEKLQAGEVSPSQFPARIEVLDPERGEPARFVTASVANGTLMTLAFGPDGNLLLGSFEVRDPDGLKTVLWDLRSGQEVARWDGAAVAFLPGGRAIAGIEADLAQQNPAMRVVLWDATHFQKRATGILWGGEGIDPESDQSCFNLLDDHRLLTCSRPEHGPKELPITLTTWDLDSGKALASTVIHPPSGGATWFHYALAPNGQALATTAAGPLSASISQNVVSLWDVAQNRVLHQLADRAPPAATLAFSPDGQKLYMGTAEGEVLEWSLAGAMRLRRLVPPAQGARLETMLLNRDATRAVIGTRREVQVWDLGRARRLASIAIPADKFQFDLALSPDDRLLALSERDVQSFANLVVRLYRVEDQQLAAEFPDQFFVSFSPDGRYLATGFREVTLWDLATRQALRKLPGAGATFFSPDSRLAATYAASPYSEEGSFNEQALQVKLSEVATGRELQTLPVESATWAPVFSPDGRLLVTGGNTRFNSPEVLRLWDLSSGQELRQFRGHQGGIGDRVFRPDGKLLATAGEDRTVRLWDVATGKEIASLISLGGEEWAVVTPQGLFDASPGGMKLLHFTVGLEPISLGQLKDRYYEPGLLRKLLGYNPEPVRDVSALGAVGLFPEVRTRWLAPTKGLLEVQLRNRGGGLGRVQVLVNGKEYLEDARPRPWDPAAPTATFSVDLSRFPGVLGGEANRVEVVARNADDYLASRGFEVDWVPPGAASRRPPEFWAIVGGISRYGAPALELRYAAKDATDMAQALELGARRLFGADRVHLTLLASSDDPRALPPTKANFLHAFEEARRAHPEDVFLLYLAGHGTTLARGSDLYLYLTADARGFDLSDPELRRASSISSEELVQWVKQVPALKQVMILDTCGAGGAAAKLVEKRDVPGDQVRAIDRLKDRTGFHVLMGSAADAVSYEATRYGQGLLTYALLQGMRGAALREDEYVDVSRLFQYAADKVPELAADLGGIQRPLVAAPGGTSFDVGLLTSEDKREIPLAAVHAMVLRPSLIDRDQGFDDLNLTSLLRQALRDRARVEARGPAQAVYVDEEELPGALRPTGTYAVEGDQVTVNLVLRREGATVARREIQGQRGDLPGLVQHLLDAISDAAKP